MARSEFVNAKRLRRFAALFRKERFCPCCGWRGFRFEPFGNIMVRRHDAQCPICGSLERHRAAVVLLRGKIPAGQKVLHIAPEQIMIPWLVSLSSEYLNVDLYRPAMRRMDITATRLPDGSKTLVWCSHVLEHIRDDRKALSEMFRVLEAGGLLVLQVPIKGDKTIEDDFVTDGSTRLHKFLQEDHVRLYGRDLKERIETAGFSCEILSTADLPPGEQKLYSVKAPLYREVFICRKPIEVYVRPTLLS
jgi:SAM-dependent methyltransferase